MSELQNQASILFQAQAEIESAEKNTKGHIHGTKLNAILKKYENKEAGVTWAMLKDLARQNKVIA